MTTSGAGLVFQFCLLAVILGAVLSAGPILGGQLSLRRVPAGGRILWLAVAVPSALQVPFPALYEVCYRSASAVDHGEWWRLATALLVQDGGIVGTLSNLTLLAVAMLTCCPLWGVRATVSTFVLAGVCLNIAAVTAGADDGAGNSGATLALVASLPPFALAAGYGTRLRSYLGLGATIAAAITLMLNGDGHGYAITLGLLLGTAGIPLARSRSQRGLLPPPDATPTN